MRIMIAGTGSGCGKTTTTLALMGALRAKGVSVAPYKVGPDYIDTGFHEAVCGIPSHNLDAHLTDENGIRYLLHNDRDISVIEGVMGFYDGLSAVRTVPTDTARCSGTAEGCGPVLAPSALASLGLTDLRCSSYALARDTKTPVVLVADASGGAASVAAQVYGFARMIPDNTIAAVLVNRVSGPSHYELARDAILRYTGLPCVGYLKKDAELGLSSRHLGLIPAGETQGLEGKLRRAAGLIAETVDLSHLLRIAEAAPDLPFTPPDTPRRDGYRLGVARDRAFGFYYEANLDMLRRSGMELVFFSPLSDAALPENLDGLYLGGGFPEVFAPQLSGNVSMRQSVLAALNGGLHCYAECGGMMYLSRAIDGHDMVGFFPAVCRMTERLQRFGYADVEDASGLRFPAHEFHRAVFEPIEPIDTAFLVRKTARPEQVWRSGYTRGNTLAGFPHLHFLSHPELIGRLWP